MSKLDFKRETVEKLAEIYHEQQGIVPEYLPPSLYMVRIYAFSQDEKKEKVKFILETLIKQGFNGFLRILANGDILINVHYCRLELLKDNFGPIDFWPVLGKVENLPI